jgi:hypothetical protein
MMPFTTRAALDFLRRWLRITLIGRVTLDSSGGGEEFVDGGLVAFNEGLLHESFNGVELIGDWFGACNIGNCRSSFELREFVEKRIYLAVDGWGPGDFDHGQLASGVDLVDGVSHAGDDVGSNRVGLGVVKPAVEHAFSPFASGSA